MSFDELRNASTAELLAMLGRSSTSAYEGHAIIPPSQARTIQTIRHSSMPPTIPSPPPVVVIGQEEVELEERQSDMSSSRSPSPVSDWDRIVRDTASFSLHCTLMLVALFDAD